MEKERPLYLPTGAKQNALAMSAVRIYWDYHMSSRMFSTMLCNCRYLIWHHYLHICMGSRL